MKKLLFAVAAILFFASALSAQNVFPVKIEGCNDAQFCLDCGDPKATCDNDSFDKMISTLNARYNLRGARGQIAFQVLIDSMGMPCVLSHTDAQKNKITLDAIALLNQCKWIPAMDHHKAVNASVNVVFSISDGKVSAVVQRIDLKAMNENMKSPGKPVVYNKSYAYVNPSLKSYEISVWQKENSGLPNDMSQHCAVDRNDSVWYASLNGFAKFKDGQFVRLSEKNSPFKSTESMQSVAVDRENNVWVCTGGDAYEGKDGNWIKIDPAQTGLEKLYDASSYDDGAVLLDSEKGICMLKNGKWELWDAQRVKELAGRRISTVCRDRQHRLWIGTFSGSLLIDTGGKVTDLNASETPLKGTCVSGMVEDDKGNLYFSLYAYQEKRVRNRPEEGLAVLSSDGVWKHFNDENSGMPSDHINSLLFDKFEKILWIGTNESGLVRYDLKDGWENYHNENSKVPSIYIYDMTQDSKGDVYVSTYYGMMRVRKIKAQ